MERKHTLYVKNGRSRLPLTHTAFVFFLMYFFHAPGWAFGVVGTIYGIFWIFSFVAVFKQEGVFIDLDVLEKMVEERIEADKVKEKAKL